ncbi:hypothetical protein [Flavobacterium aquidurense]|nr:hypothetical protein [Flavobacterium aquidurense]
MKKERILVRDDRGFFLKMFKRNFKTEFDFFESSFMSDSEDENKSEQFDRSIFVIYDKFELMQFLKLEKKGSNVLLCLFNKQLYDNLFFLEEIKSLILLDCSKTRSELMSELKHYFNTTSDSGLPASNMSLPNPNIISTQFNNFYKSLFFMM